MWWAFGVIFFAGSVMVLIGAFQAIVGILAIVQSHFYVVPPNYPYDMDPRTWGWIHVLLGTLIALTGFYLFFGKLWARILAIILLVASAVSNFLFLPYYPVWSLLIVALDVVALWAIAAHGRELNV
jgi:hypothetical protein